MGSNQHGDVLNAYIGTPLEHIEVIFPLKRQAGAREPAEKNLWNYFQDEKEESDFGFIRIVDDPAHADCFLAPHNYFALKKTLGQSAAAMYLSTFVTLSQTYKKNILLFAMADSDEDIDVPNSIVFRFSQYGYKKKKNEILMPFYQSPSISEQSMGYRQEIWKEISLRRKGEKPTISFCGWAGFPNAYRRMTFAARIILEDVKKRILRDPRADLRKPGIYFRRKAMAALRGSTRIRTNFIVRKSYSAKRGSDGSRKIQPEEAEREYIRSMLQSDFVLAPKGHGNGSVRFYEALSLGRFPVLINTDCVLPLANMIDYDKFAVSVEYTDIPSIERRILEFYDALDDEEFEARQKMARAAFDALRPGNFLRAHLFGSASL